MKETSTDIKMRCSKCHRVTTNLTYMNSTYPEDGLCPECYDKVKPVMTIYNPSYENWGKLKAKIRGELDQLNSKLSKKHYLTDAETSYLFAYCDIMKMMKELEVLN